MARKLQGTVVSDKMEKTVVVAVSRQKKHRLYRKQYQVTSRFKAHNPDGLVKLGDMVEITEIRPVSATKRWQVERKLTPVGKVKS